MKEKLFSLVAVIALTFAALPLAQGQEKYVKGVADNTLLKATGGGEITGATTSTATSTAAAATINADSGKITTESLNTAAAGAATYTFTLTDSLITSASKVFVSLDTASAGTPSAPIVTPGNGTCTIKIQNAHPTAAFNNTFKISFFVVK